MKIGLLNTQIHITKNEVSVDTPIVRTYRWNRSWSLCWISTAFFMRKPRRGSRANGSMKSFTTSKWRFDRNEQ